MNTVPLVLMMKELGVHFQGLEKGVKISERRNEYECEDTGEQDIIFAVKTCEQFHQTRIPVIKNTWGNFAKYVNIYSDKQDDNVPTIKLPNWVEPQIKKFFGCNKTLSILKHFLDESAHHNWLVLVDDDTILSVARVRSMISCYRDQVTPVMIGMRVGFISSIGEGSYFPAGGAGIVLNRDMVESLVSSCKCWDPEWMVRRDGLIEDDPGSREGPEDLMLGVCAQTYSKVALTHTGRMFLAGPDEYFDDFLTGRKPVSFHKHNGLDPLQIYRTWFEESDREMAGGREEL